MNTLDAVVQCRQSVRTEILTSSAILFFTFLWGTGEPFSNEEDTTCKIAEWSRSKLNLARVSYFKLPPLDVQHQLVIFVKEAKFNRLHLLLHNIGNKEPPRAVKLCSECSRMTTSDVFSEGARFISSQK